MSGFPIAVGDLTAVYTTAQYDAGATPRLGSVRKDAKGSKTYIFLKNSGSSAIAAKQCAVSLTTGKAAFTCALPAATNNLPFAGSRVSGATSMAQNEYGWFQIKGSATLIADAAGTTAEAYVTTSNATAGSVEALAGTAAVDAVNAFGIAETTTTAGDVVVHLTGGVYR